MIWLPDGALEHPSRRPFGPQGGESHFQGLGQGHLEYWAQPLNILNGNAVPCQ